MSTVPSVRDVTWASFERSPKASWRCAAGIRSSMVPAPLVRCPVSPRSRGTGVDPRPLVTFDETTKPLYWSATPKTPSATSRTAFARETRGGPLVELGSEIGFKRWAVSPGIHREVAEVLEIRRDPKPLKGVIDCLELPLDIRVQRHVVVTQPHRTPPSAFGLHGAALSRRWSPRSR